MKNGILKISLLIVFFIESHLAFADGEHWVCNYYEFPYNSTFISVITIDGVEQRSEQLELGAFNNGTCRGSVLCQYEARKDRYFAYLTVSASNGMELTFRLYDHATEQELDVTCEVAYTFMPDENFGLPRDPYIFPFTTNSSEVVFNGSVNNLWSEQGNWNGGVLPGNSDIVVINSSCVLDIDAEVQQLAVSNGQSLIIQNGGTLAVGSICSDDATKLVIAEGGQLVHGNENVLATLQKNIIGYTGEKDRYYLIANPTANPAVANLNANEYDLFTFDPTHELEWVYQPEPTITQNEGYLYANSSDITLEFAGILTPAGEETIGLAYYNGTGSGREYPGFNLVGNPFACNAYISGNYYRMNNTEFIAATGEPIAPCEGIFVEATGVGQSITFTTTVPNMEANIEMSLSQGRSGIIDRAILNFGNSYNLHKFMMDESNTQLYIPQDGEKYAAFTMENAIGEMPINFKAAQNGTYTITVHVENASCLHLIDNLTGVDTDLLAISSKGFGSYTFTALTTDYASRFKLVFSMTGISENVADTSFAYLSNGNLVVTNARSGNTLQIIDALGRVVTNEKLGENSTIGIQDLKAGVYVLHLINDEKIMIQKIVKD